VSPPQVNGNEAAASSNPNLFTPLLSEMLHGISSNRLDVKGQKWNPLARRRFQRGHLVLKQNKSGAVWIGRFKFKVDILVNGKVQSFQRAEVLGDLKEYPDSTACPACTRVKTVHGVQPCVPRPAPDQDQRSINSRPNGRQSYWANGHPVPSKAAEKAAEETNVLHEDFGFAKAANRQTRSIWSSIESRREARLLRWHRPHWKRGCSTALTLNPPSGKSGVLRPIRSNPIRSAIGPSSI
jgi:hypothetical protein